MIILAINDRSLYINCFQCDCSKTSAKQVRPKHANICFTDHKFGAETTTVCFTLFFSFTLSSYSYSINCLKNCLSLEYCFEAAVWVWFGRFFSYSRIVFNVINENPCFTLWNHVIVTFVVSQKHFPFLRVPKV